MSDLLVVASVVASVVAIVLLYLAFLNTSRRVSHPLDALALSWGLKRQHGESDEALRERIVQHLTCPPYLGRRRG